MAPPLPRPPGRRDRRRRPLDLYPTGRGIALPMERRTELVEARVAELAGLGASVHQRFRDNDPARPVYLDGRTRLRTQKSGPGQLLAAVRQMIRPGGHHG